MNMQSNTDWVLEHWKEGVAFPSLGFVKHSECEDWCSTMEAFENAIRSIAAMNIKKNRGKMNCIQWARKVQNTSSEIINTAAVKRYLYLKVREHHLATKKYLKAQLKRKAEEADVRMLEESLSEEPLTSSNSSDMPTSNSSDMPTSSSSRAETSNIRAEASNSRAEASNSRAEASNSRAEASNSRAEASNSRAEAFNGDSNNEIGPLESMYIKLDPNKKWTLSTGKCVDDELYMFALQCTHDHPSSSLIMDPEDASYLQYGVFTEAELDEIRQFQLKPLPKMPDDLKKHLMMYNLNNAVDIRRALLLNNTFEIYNEEKDWINFTIYQLLRQFEAGNTEKQHLEAWYETHIWSMCQNVFDKIKDLEAIVGESVSHASRKRKNSDRTIAGIEDMHDSKFGHKLDMIFRQGVASHTEPLEYGGGESGKLDLGPQASKCMVERFYKLPRALKDMMDRLSEEVLDQDLYYKQLATVGFIHSGLRSQMIVMDRPTQYVSRVSSYKPNVIGSDISQFGSTVLPAVYSAWVCCQIVLRVMNFVNASDASKLDLDTCLLNAPPPPMPVTSSSTETAAVSSGSSKKKMKSRQ